MLKMRVVFQGFCLYSWTTKGFMLETTEKIYEKIYTQHVKQR